MPRTRPILAALALLVLPVLTAACISRPIKEKVWSDGYTEAFLRSEKKGSRTVHKGFEHPTVIAPVRMAHILSRIDLREGDGGDRVPAIPLDTLFTAAEAMADGLAKANPDQEVVVQSVRRSKKLLLFDHKYLTSMLAYVKNDMLYIHISRSDWEIPPRKEERLPETHVGEYPLDFRLVVDKGMSLVDQQAVAVQWRDPIFKKPTRTRVTGTGKVVRRTVLMESAEDDTEFDKAPKVEDLSAEQLRALADLEEARRRGDIPESEYYARKNAILRGELPAP